MNYTKFAALLSERNLKVAEVAKITRISPSTFSDWKNGKYTPKIDKIQKIAEFFNVPISYFLESEEENHE
ncbi:MAG: helix-turn-helix domain-containing protein [Thomasclavelia spiroformis]|jgi:transcriptional regulator with XRE-family HTH domain